MGLALLAASSGSIDAVSGWTNPAPILGATGQFAATVDFAGHLHVALVTNKGVFYATDASGAWGLPRKVASFGGWGPSIAVDPSSGRIWIAVVRRDPRCPCQPDTSFAIYVASGTPGHWSLERRSFGQASVTSPSIRVLHGRVHLAWAQDKVGILYSTRATAAGSHWQTELAAADAIDTVLSDPHPVLRVGDDDTAHIVYAHTGGPNFTRSGGLRYATNRTLNGSFTVQTMTTSFDWSADLVLDPLGHARVVFDRAHAATFYLAQQASGSWSAPIRIARHRGSDSITLDSMARPLVALSDGTGVWFASQTANGAWLGAIQVAAFGTLPVVRLQGTWASVLFSNREDPPSLYLARQH